MLNACPFCHHGDATTVWDAVPDRSGAPRRVVACRECGTWYPEPRFGPEEISAYFAAPADRPEPRAADPSSPLPAPTALWRLKRLLAPVGFPFDYRRLFAIHHIAPRTALDVGANDGRFCRALDAQGFDCVGLEIDERLVATGRANGARLELGSFPDRLPPAVASRKFDLIASLESVYYFSDAKAAMVKFLSLLAPGGHLLIKCHLATSPYYRATGHGPFRRYGDYVQSMPTPASLRFWVARAGFDLLDSVAAPWGGDGGGWPSRLWARLGSVKIGAWQPLPDVLADGIVLLARKPR